MATLSNIISAGVITNVSSGGTGVTTLTGLVKANGTSAFTAAAAGTDYVSPTGTEVLTNKTITSATLTGTPQAVTAANATSNSMIATTQFVLNNIPVPVASGISTGKAIAMSMIFGF
jgi:hypothetical protein